MRQGLPGERQRSPRPLFGAERRPSIQEQSMQDRRSRQGPGKRSLPGQGGKAPARGACRDDRAEASRPRQEELAGKAVPGFTMRDPSKRDSPGRLEDYITGDTPRRYTRPGEAQGATGFRARRAPWPGKIKTPARHLPGRVVLCARAPAHRTTRRTGSYSRDAWRVAVQPGGHGGTPLWRSHRRGKRRRSDRRFWGRRRRALNALVPHCQSRWRPLFAHCIRTVTTTTPFTFLPLSPTLTPVGDPLRYKRRPVCNVEGVQTFATQIARTLGVASASSSRALQLNNNQAGVGFYASIAARTWVNRTRARHDLLFVLPPPSRRTNEGAPVP